jgi:HK97 family phage major capsid protein
LARLFDARNRTDEKIQDTLALAEQEERSLDEKEQAQLERYRAQISEWEVEIRDLNADLERMDKQIDVSATLRKQQPEQQERRQPDSPDDPALDTGVVYRTFAQYARDELIRRYPVIENAAGGDAVRAREFAVERLEKLKRVTNTTSAQIAGLTAPIHLTQILDIIMTARPVVNSARSVPLSSGQLTYPQITTRPTVIKQGAEKTEGGTGQMTVVMGQLLADTYIGGGDLSWQTITWSTPDALTLWFDLAAEAYARQTETAACTELQTNGGGTTTYKLSTAGTEDFNAWRAIIMGGLQSIYNTTGGRQQTNTLYLSADKFFALAGLGTANVLQLSSVGGLDIATMTGTYAGLKVVGSYGFAANQAIIGDSSVFLAGENQGAPVELRVTEPTIGGMQVGVIGAFKSKVYDPARFVHIA